MPLLLPSVIVCDQVSFNQMIGKPTSWSQLVAIPCSRHLRVICCGTDCLFALHGLHMPATSTCGMHTAAASARRLDNTFLHSNISIHDARWALAVHEDEHLQTHSQCHCTFSHCMCLAILRSCLGGRPQQESEWKSTWCSDIHPMNICNGCLSPHMPAAPSHA